MNKKQIFMVDYSVPYPDKMMIRIKENAIPCGLLDGGSWNVLPARLLGISYPNWLRFCRDEFGATLIGRESTYIVPYFSDSKKIHDLVHLLNDYANLFITEYETRFLKDKLDVAQSSKNN